MCNVCVSIVNALVLVSIYPCTCTYSSTCTFYTFINKEFVVNVHYFSYGEFDVNVFVLISTCTMMYIYIFIYMYIIVHVHVANRELKGIIISYYMYMYLSCVNVIVFCLSLVIRKYTFNYYVFCFYKVVASSLVMSLFSTLLFVDVFLIIPLVAQLGSMTPEQMQAWRWERELDERNRPMSDDELDALFPQDGYKVVYRTYLLSIASPTHLIISL